VWKPGSAAVTERWPATKASEEVDIFRHRPQ
jgi:hypothetical protein